MEQALFVLTAVAGVLLGFCLGSTRRPKNVTNIYEAPRCGCFDPDEDEDDDEDDPAERWKRGRSYDEIEGDP